MNMLNLFSPTFYFKLHLFFIYRENVNICAIIQIIIYVDISVVFLLTARIIFSNDVRRMKGTFVTGN